MLVYLEVLFCVAATITVVLAAVVAINVTANFIIGLRR